MTKPIIGITLDYHINETSFQYASYPWYALRQDYSKLVAASGGVPVLLSYDASIDDTLSVLDGLIVSGGDFDIPPKCYGHEVKSSKIRAGEKRALYEIELVQRALDKKIPFLGICNGMQVLNVALGGTLIQDIEELRPGSISHKQQYPYNQPYHPVSIKQATTLYAIAECQADWMVTSTHHQALDVLGKGLIASAFAPDGVVEAIELDGHNFALGVEWHPEYGSTKLDRDIFNAFVAASLRSKLPVS